MDCYKKKYLKYKTKYLDLKKNSIGGAVAAAMQNNKKSGSSVFAPVRSPNLNKIL